MKTVKEGTHICLQQQIIYGKDNAEDKELEYYLSIEYEVLKRNQLKTLLPVQLREKDREKNLLFDITGKQPIKKQESSNSFRQKDCERILQSIINLLEELDNYMLNLNYVEFRAEYMYIGADGQLQWIYSPQELSERQNGSEEGISNRDICKGSQEGFQERIESFFAWMLTQINYEDSNVVRFMYQLYNKVRKIGFSKELLEKYLQSRRNIDTCVIEGKQENRIQSQKNVDQKNITQRNMNENNENPKNEYQKGEYQKNTAQRNTNKRNTNPKNEYQASINQRNGYQKNTNQENTMNINKKIMKQDILKENRVHNLSGIDTRSNLEHRNPGKNKAILLYNCVRILFCILFLCSFVLEGIFIFSGIQEGFSENLFRYCIGGVLLLLAFLFGIIWSNVKLNNVRISNAKFSNDRISNTKVKRTRKSEKANSYSYKNIDTEIVDRGIADTENTDTGIAGRPLMIKTDADWESDGVGTTILGGAERENDMPENCIYPMLQEIETGIVYIIKNCPFYIGSAAGVNQLEIPDKTVSRAHAVILEDFQEEEYMGYIIRDMNSTNGTWINGRKMKKGSQEPLKEGEIIRFAQKEYKFLLQDIS